ncbi:MAG: hypothetical protein ABIP68_06375 [Ferruginibacter sp.]
MLNTRQVFHLISYLQYPMMVVAIFYVLKPYFNGFEKIWEDYNYALIFMGLAVTLSTLQDTTKTQNKLSKNIWQNPKKGKMALFVLGLMALFFILYGMYGIYVSTNEVLEQVSYGIFVMGMGLIGMLKAAMEMYENHRLDKHPPVKTILKY